MCVTEGPLRTLFSRQLTLATPQDRHQVPHGCRSDLLADEAGVHPAVRCSRPVRARGLDEPPDEASCDGSDSSRTVFHRGCGRRAYSRCHDKIRLNADEGKPGPQIPHGGSIASEGKGEYMYCEGRVLDIAGKPIPNCTIETWETDDDGLYDTQYADRDHPDCRGRLKSDENGYYAVSFARLAASCRTMLTVLASGQYRLIKPTPYPIRKFSRPGPSAALPLADATAAPTSLRRPRRQVRG